MVLAPEQDNYGFPAMLEARTASKEEQGGWAAETKLVDGNLWKATFQDQIMDNLKKKD